MLFKELFNSFKFSLLDNITTPKNILDVTAMGNNVVIDIFPMIKNK